MEQVSEHPDAALLDLGRAWILGVIDEVAVQVLGDDPLCLRFHPGGDEGGQVSRRIALEDEVLGNQPHGIHGGHARLREFAARHLLRGEAIAEEHRVGDWSGIAVIGFSFDVVGLRGRGLSFAARTACLHAGSIKIAPNRKQTAPSSVPMIETGLLINSPVLGSTKLASAEAMNKIDPIMFSQAIHHGNERGRS